MNCSKFKTKTGIKETIMDIGKAKPVSFTIPGRQFLRVIANGAIAKFELAKSFVKARICFL